MISCNLGGKAQQFYLEADTAEVVCGDLHVTLRFAVCGLSQHDNTFGLDSLNSAFSKKSYCWARVMLEQLLCFQTTPEYTVCVHTLRKGQFMCAFTEKKARKIVLHLIGLCDKKANYLLPSKPEMFFKNVIIIVNTVNSCFEGV